MNDLPVSHEDDLLRLAFDLAPSGMVAVGTDGRILLANREAERMFGFASGTLAGRSVETLVPAVRRGGHSASRDGFFATPETRRMGAGRDLHALRADGTEFPVEIGLQPVRLTSGTIAVATIVDISTRIAAEKARRDLDERARQTQKLEALGTLAGGIAHDFNNILLGIVGYTELAQRALRKGGEVPAGAVTDDLDQVLRAAERGRQLVRRILMFTRHGEVARTSLSLDRVVGEASQLLRASLPATIQMRVAIADALPPVLADETLVHQIVLNLGTNAAHAMEAGGTLSITLAEAAVDEAGTHATGRPGEGRYVRLGVADTGTGMSPEVRARAFEPFFTTKPAGKGTGLGLSVILGIVQSLGGAIDLVSEPGVGTRVDVWLPVAPSTLGAAAASGTHAPDARGARHVLFVEDEPALASLERRQLEALGFRVTVHTSSLEALEDFRTRPDAFDLLVTDNTMPHLTGLALSREITRIRPRLPVLMISGYAENADHGVLDDHGVRAVLRKPHTSAELDEALRRLMGEA